MIEMLLLVASATVFAGVMGFYIGGKVAIREERKSLSKYKEKKK
jgi:hypothetical protein